MLFSPCAAWSVPKSRWPGRTDLTDRLQTAFYGQLGKRWVRHSSGCVFVLKKQRHCSGWRRRRSADIVSTSHSHWLAWRLLLFRQTRKKHGSHGAWNSWQLLLEICVTSFSFTLLQAVTQPPSLLVSGKRWHWKKNSRTVPSSKRLLTSSSEMTILKLLSLQVSERLYCCTMAVQKRVWMNFGTGCSAQW